MNVATATNRSTGPSATETGFSKDDVVSSKDKEIAPNEDTSESYGMTEEPVDDEVKVAMAMAMAASQNPHMTPDQLRRLVAEQLDDQSSSTAVVQQNQQRQQTIVQNKQKEVARQRWEAQKQNAVSWIKGTVQEVQTAAAHHTQVLRDQAERRRFHDVIKQDDAYQGLRKRAKLQKKQLKAYRLAGNRVETRHAFKRQRMEKHLLQRAEKLRKSQTLFLGASYNVHLYAKAMIQASHKWNKPPATQEELSLEAQLCRNMHQMLTIEKQKSKVKKETRHLRKYLSRCKGWLEDKRALCEKDALTLEATSNSLMTLYQDTIAQQEMVIAKIMEREELGNDVEAFLKPADDDDVVDPDVAKYNQLTEEDGPGATLCVLQGKPIPTPEQVAAAVRAAAPVRPPAQAQQQQPRPKKSKKPKEAKKAPTPVPQPPTAAETAGRHELFIETKDDGSISSHLSDPDSPDGAEAFDGEAVNANVDIGNDDDNVNDNAEAAAVVMNQDSGKSEEDFKYGTDAPWTASAEAQDASSQESSTPTPPSLPPTTTSAEAAPEVPSSSRQEEESATTPPKAATTTTTTTTAVPKRAGSMGASASEDSMACSISMDGGVSKYEDSNNGSLAGANIPSSSLYMSHTEQSYEADDDDALLDRSVQEVVVATDKQESETSKEEPSSEEEPQEAEVPEFVQTEDVDVSSSEED